MNEEFNPVCCNNCCKSSFCIADGCCSCCCCRCSCCRCSWCCMWSAFLKPSIVGLFAKSLCLLSNTEGATISTWKPERSGWFSADFGHCTVVTVGGGRGGGGGGICAAAATLRSGGWEAAWRDCKWVASTTEGVCLFSSKANSSGVRVVLPPLSRICFNFAFFFSSKTTFNLSISALTRAVVRSIWAICASESTAIPSSGRDPG